MTSNTYSCLRELEKTIEATMKSGEEHGDIGVKLYNTLEKSLYRVKKAIKNVDENGIIDG